MKVFLCVLFVIGLCLLQTDCSQEKSEPSPSSYLYKCVTWGDPAVQIWHPSNKPPPLERICQTAGMFELARNQYLTLSVRTRPLGYMVELTLNFFNGTSKKPICSMVSDDFLIEPSDDCSRYGISHYFVKSPTLWALNIWYPRAEFNTIITHMPQNGPAHFVVNLWQPGHSISKTTGMCSTGLCSSHRNSLDPSYNLNAKISSSEAKQICHLYYDQYLNKLSQRRTPQQRNPGFNSTIQAVFDQCVFDVSATGLASAALSGLEVLMVEDITSDIVTLDDITTNFKDKIHSEISVLSTTIRRADFEVNNFLKKTV